VGVPVCSDVSGVLVHGDGLEVPAIDLLNHVPFWGLKSYKSKQPSLNSQSVIRTDAEPLGGRLHLDRPPGMKCDIHYLKRRCNRFQSLKPGGEETTQCTEGFVDACPYNFRTLLGSSSARHFICFFVNVGSENGYGRAVMSNVEGAHRDVPHNLRERVHVLQRALEHRHPQEFLPERAEVAERDRGARTGRVERRDLLADEVVFCLCVERGLVCPEVVVLPPRALDVQRSRREGDVRLRMGGCGIDGSGERKACRGRIEVQERGFSCCGCINWWWWGILTRDHGSVETRCVAFKIEGRGV